MKTIYHDDAYSADDWSLIVNGEEPPRPVVTEDTTDRVNLENEYLSQVFQKFTYYAVPQRKEEIGEEGEVRHDETPMVFEVVSIRGAHSRPHLMPTFESADDIVLTAALAIEVQPMQLQPGHAVDVHDLSNNASLHVFKDADAYWISARDVAPFSALGRELVEYRRVTNSDDENGVLVLADVHKAKPRCSIMDPNCPTLCITWALRNAGWTPFKKTMIVKADNVAKKECDGREAVKWKFYFQVLWIIDKILPLTSSVPSQQPIKFYKFLLRGVPVEPYLTDQQYTLVLNDVLKKKGKPLVPLEDVGAPTALPAPVPLPLDDDDGFIVDEEPQPKAKAKAKATQRSGGSSGSGGVAPVPILAGPQPPREPSAERDPPPREPGPIHRPDPDPDILVHEADSDDGVISEKELGVYSFRGSFEIP